MIRHLLTSLSLLLVIATGSTALDANAASAEHAWFEQFKNTATDQELLQFLYAMPKGGDLHNHLAGAVHPEWYLQLGLDAAAHGYKYFTKVRINNCRFDTNEFGGNAYLLLFRNIAQHQFDALSDCDKSEYIALEDLNPRQKTAWLASLRLDQRHEGRAEFFEAHWARVGGLLSNPYLLAEALYLNMREFGAEGLLYLETQIPVNGFSTANGEPIAAEDVLAIYRERINRADAKATGVTVRLQLAILRFLPMAEDHLRAAYSFVATHPEFVGVNMVGREDNDKGYPLRFLATFRALRHSYSGVRLSIHAGEVDEPNQHVRDTLLLGADRIGHGVNLITDPDTMLLMRHGPYLVEINLISNLLLNYVESYAEHPFPEYLRTGIPVALSTDDRGMWDSTLTDEFFVAVREFNLTWAEIVALSQNSLSYSFVEEPVKQTLVDTLNKRLAGFERRFKTQSKTGTRRLAQPTPTPQYRGFLCQRYGVCAAGN